MKSKPEIRRAGAPDLGEIVRIEQACFGADAFSRRQLSYLIRLARGACLVAVVSGKIAGYISLLARPRIANLRIYSVAVAPQARGLGIGQTLLDSAVEYAREQNAREISLEVSVANSAALALYRKNGFAVVSRIPGYYHDGGDGWRMKRLLTPDTGKHRPAQRDADLSEETQTMSEK